MEHRNQNVLLIDDDQSLREVVSILLTDEGFRVTQAENGEEALKLLKGMSKEELPSCLILDVMMPVMSGDELLERLEKEHQEQLGAIPVIVCSAEGRIKNYNQVVAKIEKPINMELLCGAIKGCSGLFV
jgi:CheY-like chemotaxis protein